VPVLKVIGHIERFKITINTSSSAAAHGSSNFEEVRRRNMRLSSNDIDLSGEGRSVGQSTHSHDHRRLIKNEEEEILN
jgi:hypothetical protein